MRVIISVLLVALLFAGQGLFAAPKSYNDPVLESLIQKHQKGGRLFEMAKTKRDANIRRLKLQKASGKINTAQFDIEFKKVNDTFDLTSRRLTRRYRAPIVERLQTMLPELRDSLGTGFYQKKSNGDFVLDARGRKIINPKHRGWKGDFDFSGSQKTLSEFGKIMSANGAALDVNPTQTSIKKLEFTVNSETIQAGAQSSLAGAQDRVNRLAGEELDIQKKMVGASAAQKQKLQKKLDVVQQDLKTAKRKFAIREAYNDRVSRPGFSDSMENPGSSAHRDLQDIRARDVETFNSASMRKGQVFRQSVEVEDHIKKASKALGEAPSALYNNSDAARAKFQALSKSTQKAIDTVNMSDAELGVILKKNGYPGDASAFRSELELFKLQKKYATSGSQADVKRLQDIAREVFSTSRRKATRLDTARLKALEKSLGGLSPEAKLKVQSEIVDGQERLRATRKANLDREFRAGYKLDDAPDIPANSKTPAGNWFLNGMGIDPSSRTGKFFSPPSPDGKIVKYGGLTLGVLGLVMVNQVVQSKVHEVADEPGLFVPVVKLTGKTLLEMADFAGVSPESFTKGLIDDVTLARKIAKKMGLENTGLEAQLVMLAAGISPVKSIVKGGVTTVTQLGGSIIEASTLLATIPSAYLEKWGKLSALEQRLMTDKLFRQASQLSARRQSLTDLELDIAISSLQSGLKAGQVGSSLVAREHLEAGLEADTLSDEAAIKHLEAKIGKMSDREKLDFIQKREERRIAIAADPLARWDRAAEAQADLGARLGEIEAKLAKGRGSYSSAELEKLRGELVAVR
ncbi:MAG: hypothetical protein GXP03_02240, partial [Alphaproteobacteria bacterium]|nr:hypothetical protein [Alphaproteobacteria bacterium]